MTGMGRGDRERDGGRFWGMDIRYPHALGEKQLRRCFKPVFTGDSLGRLSEESNVSSSRQLKTLMTSLNEITGPYL